MVIRRTAQLAIQPRRRNLQHIRSAADGIVDVENRAYLAAQVGTIFVSHAARLVDVNAQHAGFSAPAHLYLYYFKSAGDTDPLHDFAHSLEVKCHSSNNLRVRCAVPKTAETKKWACAHWCASPKSGTYTTVSKHQYTLLAGKKQTGVGCGAGIPAREKAGQP